MEINEPTIFDNGVIWLIVFAVGIGLIYLLNRVVKFSETKFFKSASAYLKTAFFVVGMVLMFLPMVVFGIKILLILAPAIVIVVIGIITKRK